MTTDNDDQINAIVDAVLEEIYGEPGIGDTLKAIKNEASETYEGMLYCCRAVVRDVIAHSKEDHERLIAVENAILNACWRGTEQPYRDNCRICGAPESRPHYANGNGTKCPGDFVEESEQQAFRDMLWESVPHD